MNRSNTPSAWAFPSRVADGRVGRSKAAAVSREELRLAVRAVLVHTAQHWPGGEYCSCDRSRFPCRLRLWGERVLLAAGWQRERIDEMVHRAETDPAPWLADDGVPSP